VIIGQTSAQRTKSVFLLSYTFAVVARQKWRFGREQVMGGRRSKRLICERAIDGDGGRDSSGRTPSRPIRSVTVDLAESPLGWLHSRGMVSRRQYDAGERLRADWERSRLQPRVTMSWDAAPIAAGRGGSAPEPDLGGAQIDARRRFDDAIAAAGPGLSEILWRVVCAGEGMRDAETALGWPARAGKLVLTLALDRIADYYRIR
jgi:hypothetical protein